MKVSAINPRAHRQHNRSSISCSMILTGYGIQNLTQAYLFAKSLHSELSGGYGQMAESFSLANIAMRLADISLPVTPTEQTTIISQSSKLKRYPGSTLHSRFLKMSILLYARHLIDITTRATRLVVSLLVEFSFWEWLLLSRSNQPFRTFNITFAYSAMRKNYYNPQIIRYEIQQL